MFKNNISKCKASTRHLSRESTNWKVREISVLFLPDTDKIMNLILSKKMPLPQPININIIKTTLTQLGKLLWLKEWENLMTLWDNLPTKASTNKSKNTLKWWEKRILISSIWLKRRKNSKVKWNKEFLMLILKLFRVNTQVWSNSTKKSLRIKLMSSEKWSIIWKIWTEEITNLYKKKSLLLTRDLRLRSGKEISIKRRELIWMFKWISKCSWPISKIPRKKFKKDKKK